MITTYLVNHSSLVPAALLLVTVVCVAAGFLLLRNRRHGRRALQALLALSALPVLALTLLPDSGLDPHRPFCVAQFSLPRLGSVELLANVALFVPLTFFATLVTRRPLLMLAAGSGLSAAIELLQGSLPALARACDTNDWLMNSVGTLAGVALGWCTLALADRRVPGSRT